MTFGDRLLRSLFVACAVGLGWGIRGDFGHMIGAMVPGALLGMAFVYATGQRSAMKWMPIFAAFGAFFISLGGLTSYAHLHGYAKSDSPINYSFGLFCLVLQGGSWGGFGGAALGLLMEKKRLTAGQWFSAAMTSYACGWLLYYWVVDLLGWDINPPRSNESIAFFGHIAGLLLWMIVNKQWMGLRGLALGFMGFGVGMSVGRIADNAMAHAPFAINSWNVMETGCGFLGGLVFAFGMLGQPFPDPPEKEEGWSGVSVLGIFYVMGFIPLLHRLTRIQLPSALEGWAQTFIRNWKVSPELAQTYAVDTLRALNVVVAAGFVAALVWLGLWRKNLVRWSAFPVLAFSALILLFQNLNSVYVAEVHQPGFVNMHTVFWWLFAYLVLFAIAFELIWPKRDVLDEPEHAARLPWVRWAITMLVIYAATVGAAHFTNDEITMRSANKRWPLWAWKPESPESVLRYERWRHVRLPDAIRGKPEEELRRRRLIRQD